MIRPRNSVGIWGFGPTATRFMPGGYHPAAHQQSVVEWTKRAVDGLGDLLDGLEFHYPGECNEDNLPQIQRALGGSVDLYCLALGLFSNPRYAKGSFINPSADLRREAINVARRAVDMAQAVGARLIVWPGGEGYNYPFQVDFVNAWTWFIDALAEITAYAADKNVTVFLEHKNSEPAMKILMRDIGMTLYTIQKVGQRGVDTANLLVNMDWQHLVMNGENLPEYAALLMAEGKLGHHHSNSGWGTFDDDNMTGALCFMQTLALAKELQLGDYGSGGERVGFDLFPYTEDPVAAVRRSILNWEWIWDRAEQIDSGRLRAARAESDAVAALTEVYRALGLDEEYERRIVERKRS
ncbi:MAG: TIM barrel protein [Candidatus Alcyoniella australis]|nr:TIM barrel protein [Candidatus Alcyoniella australis]